ncbi:aminoacyl-tRNA hydrolase [Amaricoccus macauensis]|uniref:aminoacyl-tRNA hydrolase n=1 Tax=Amaricoccus macauensis TaxID=57001 RepID=UPI003C7A0866
MKLFAGLGNPGEKYARNRHNVGFMAVEAIAEAHGFGPWRAKFSGQLAEGRLGTEKILLLKPDTFMNRSGDSVQAAAAFYKLAPEDITVFHDELDLGPGKLRVKSGGGHAGHNGLRSIAGHLGPDFRRVRIGIGHPGNKKLVSNYVLGDFAKFEHDWLEPLLEGIAEGAPALATGDTSAFMNAVSRRTAPAKPERKPKEATRPAAAPPKPKAPAPEEEPANDTQSLLRKLAEKFR